MLSKDERNQLSRIEDKLDFLPPQQEEIEYDKIKPLIYNVPVNGNKSIDILVPNCYEFVSIYNETPYVIDIFLDRGQKNRFIRIPSYSLRSVPLLVSGMNQEYRFVFNEGHGQNNILIVFSDTYFPLNANSVVNGFPLVSMSSLTQPLTLPRLGVNNINQLYNNASVDLQRSNIQGIVLSSKTRTATLHTNDYINHNGKTLLLYLNVSNISGSPSIVVTIQAKDPVSHVYFDIVSFPAVTGTGQNLYIIGPGLTETIAETNVYIQSLSVPRIWRCHIIHNNTSAITYSLGYALNV